MAKAKNKEDAIADMFGPRMAEAAGARSGPSNLVPIWKKTSEPKEAKEGDIRHIPIGQLVANEQHRTDFSQEDIDAMAANINELGLIQPISVRWLEDDQLFEIVAGERRYRAVKQLGLVEVPCIITEADNAKKSALQLAENLMRKNLNPIDEANAFKDVMEQNGWTVEQTAEFYGRARATVFRSLELLQLPGDIQNDVAVGKLTPKAAREILRVPDDSKRRRVAATVVDDSLSAAEAKQLATSTKGRTITSTKKKSPSFDTDHGKVVITVAADSSYHHVEEALKQAIEEVRLRIDNRVTL